MRMSEADIARFWSKVRKSDECWIWIAGRYFPAGYGQFFLDGRDMRAHRTSWTIVHGPIPDGLWVLHKCDNPPCVRPDHLFLGTRSDNMRDCVSKGRHVEASKTHCPNGHAYTPDNVYQIKNRSSRYCRACTRIARAAYEETRQRQSPRHLAVHRLEDRRAEL